MCYTLPSRAGRPFGVFRPMTKNGFKKKKKKEAL
jgi:hypothetical protein